MLLLSLLFLLESELVLISIFDLHNFESLAPSFVDLLEHFLLLLVEVGDPIGEVLGLSFDLFGRDLGDQHAAFHLGAELLSAAPGESAVLEGTWGIPLHYLIVFFVV